MNLAKLKLMHSKQIVRIRYFQTSEAKQCKKQKLRNASNHSIIYAAKTTKTARHFTRQSWLAFPTLRQCDRLSFSSCLERNLTANQLNDSYNEEKSTIFRTRNLSLCPLVALMFWTSKQGLSVGNRSSSCSRQTRDATSTKGITTLALASRVKVQSVCRCHFGEQESAPTPCLPAWI